MAKVIVTIRKISKLLAKSNNGYFVWFSAAFERLRRETINRVFLIFHRFARRRRRLWNAYYKHWFGTRIKEKTRLNVSTGDIKQKRQPKRKQRPTHWCIASNIQLRLDCVFFCRLLLWRWSVRVMFICPSVRMEGNRTILLAYRWIFSLSTRSIYNSINEYNDNEYMCANCNADRGLWTVFSVQLFLFSIRLLVEGERKLERFYK